VNTLSSSFASHDGNVQRNGPGDSVTVWLGDLEITCDNEPPGTAEEDKWPAEGYSVKFCNYLHSWSVGYIALFPRVEAYTDGGQSANADPISM